MSERPRGIETEKGRAPGGDKEMREQGLDRDAGSPARRRRGKRGTEGPGKETDIPRRRKVLEGMSQPPRPLPAKRPCRRPGWGWGGGPRATVPPPLPPSALHPPHACPWIPVAGTRLASSPRLPLKI